MFYWGYNRHLSQKKTPPKQNKTTKTLPTAVVYVDLSSIYSCMTKKKKFLCINSSILLSAVVTTYGKVFVVHMCACNNTVVFNINCRNKWVSSCRSPTKAFVSFAPSRAEQKSGISGQFIVQYDVDRSEDAGDLIVSWSTVNLFHIRSIINQINSKQFKTF